MTATQNNSFRGWIHLNLAQIVRALKAFAASTNPGCSDRHGAPVAPSAWGVTGADGLTSDMPVSGAGGILCDFHGPAEKGAPGRQNSPEAGGEGVYSPNPYLTIWAPNKTRNSCSP